MYELKTVNFSTYCIYILLDFRINTDHFPKRISRKVFMLENGKVLCEVGISFILIGLYSPNFYKRQSSNVESPHSALNWRE